MAERASDAFEVLSTMNDLETRRAALRALASAATMILIAHSAVAGICELLDFGRAVGYGAVVIGEGKSSIKELDLPGDWSIAMASAVRLLDQGGPNTFENGTVDYHAGVELKVNFGEPWEVGGGFREMDLTGVAEDVINVLYAAAALTPTQTIAGFTSSTTITGSGGTNVILVTGAIELGSGETLTISGSASDIFVFNLEDDMKLKDGAQMVLDGVNPSQIIWNMVGDSKDFELKDLVTYGTFINPTGKIKVERGGPHHGAFIGYRVVLKEATFYEDIFICPNPLCPDPEVRANLGAPAAARGRGTINSDFYYAHFDPATLEGWVESYRIEPDGEIVDQDGDPMVDTSTDEPDVSRNPYWNAGENLKTDTSRVLYTTKAGSRVPFTESNLTAADLNLLEEEVTYVDPAGEDPDVTTIGALFPNYPASEVDTMPKLLTAVIDFVHGKDAFDEDNDGDYTELRPIVLSDIFHSNLMFVGMPGRRLLLEDGYPDYREIYGPRDRVLYVGANDGMLHAFDAGAYWDGVDDAYFDAGTGDELFGYIPGALLDRIKLKSIDNRHLQYMVDGMLSVADVWLGDGSGTDTSKSEPEWATVLLAGYREGGAGLLALDVTKPGAADGEGHGPYPLLLWEFTHAKLGDTWSGAVMTRVKVEGTSGSGDHCGDDDGDGDCREQWVAIFGGGYSETGDPNEAAFDVSSTLSKALFMVALDTGQVLASVEFDASGANGPTAMRFSIASQPAVLDTDYDGFADVVYVGDLGGQVWKWDLSNIGDDTDSNGTIDNWAAGVFFQSAPQAMGGGAFHYRSFFYPPIATMNRGTLRLGFGSGERRQMLHIGDASLDDNNRLFVVQDPAPNTIGSTLTESNLTNVTSVDLYVDSNSGYYIVVEDGEKFVTDIGAFAGYFIAPTYLPDQYPTCGAGTAYLYILGVNDAMGFYPDPSAPPSEDRRMTVGTGIPSKARVSAGVNPSDDKIYIQTSEGEVWTLQPPVRDEGLDMIYWRQRL